MCRCVHAGVCVQVRVCARLCQVILGSCCLLRPLWLTQEAGKEMSNMSRVSLKKKKTGKNNNCKGMTWPKSHSRDMWHNIRSDRTAEVSPSSDLLRRVSNVTKFTVFTLCFYWRNSEARHRGQQNRTENSEQNPLVCDQLIFNKGPEMIRGGKELSFQETVPVSVDLHVQKNETGPLPCTTYKYYLKMDNNPIVRGLERAKPIEHLGRKKMGIYVFLP